MSIEVRASSNGQHLASLDHVPTVGEMIISKGDGTRWRIVTVHAEKNTALAIPEHGRGGLPAVAE